MAEPRRMSTRFRGEPPIKKRALEYDSPTGISTRNPQSSLVSSSSSPSSSLSKPIQAQTRKVQKGAKGVNATTSTASSSSTPKKTGGSSQHDGAANSSTQPSINVSSGGTGGNSGKRTSTTRVSSANSYREKKIDHSSSSLDTVEIPGNLDKSNAETSGFHLPSSINDGQPLPILPKPQSLQFNGKDFQNIAESRVLAISIERSRQQWMSGGNGVFEKYWVRPSKKKNTGCAANMDDKSVSSNQSKSPQPLQHSQSLQSQDKQDGEKAKTDGKAKENMVRMGQCTMIIEPHHFDITLYAVKSDGTLASKNEIASDKMSASSSISSSAIPVTSTSAARYGNSGPSKSHDYNSMQTLQNDSMQRSATSISLSTKIHDKAVEVGAPGKDGAKSVIDNERAKSPDSKIGSAMDVTDGTKAKGRDGPLPHETVTTPLTDKSRGIPAQKPRGAATPSLETPTSGASIASAVPPPSSTRPIPSPTPSQPNNKQDPLGDPVIQLLAQRAGADPQLKELMRIVAGGGATPAQLKGFQDYIGELNKLLKSQGVDRNAPVHYGESEKTENRPLPPSTNVSLLNRGGSSAPPLQTKPAFSATSAMKGRWQSTSASNKNQASSPASSVPGSLKAKSVSAHADAHSVVFEFSTTGDRYLLPRMSMLEYNSNPHPHSHANHQVIMSFLVVRPRQSEQSGQKSSHVKTPGSAHIDEPCVFQPITIRLVASNAKTIDPISRIIAPPDQVRQYMDHCFETMKRANIGYIPSRLPKDKQNQVPEPRDAMSRAIGAHGDERMTWGPPSTVIPLAA